MILDRYILSKFLPTYAAVTAAVALVVAGAHQAGSPESGALDALPTLGFPATVAGAIAFSSLTYDRELVAMYAAGISLARVCRGAYLCSAIIPIIALVIGASYHELYRVLAPAVIATGASLVGLSTAAVTASGFARREVGVVWLASLGALIIFYLGEAKIASLGDHPVFDSSCTIVLTCALLWIVWHIHNHLREML